jgi:hypothetical protein
MASASVLPWIPLWPETHRSVMFLLDRAYIAYHIPWPTSTVTLMLQGFTGLPSYLMLQGFTRLPSHLNKYKFVLLYTSFLYIPLHRLSLQRYPSETLTCTQNTLFLGLTPHTAAPDTPTILSLSAYQISPLGWRVMGQVDNQYLHRRISNLKGGLRAMLGFICPGPFQRQRSDFISRV